MIMDAGSSGTRAHIYDVAMDSMSYVPVLSNHRSLKQKPGLSRIARTTTGVLTNQAVKDALRPLLAFVRSETTDYERVPIVLKATAGLRAILDEHAKEAVMKAVRGVLKRSEFEFNEDWAQIIPGNEEGGLAWIAANYLSGILNRSDRGGTNGVIEMGGGSSQVTFEVREFSLSLSLTYIIKQM